ncbi:MAG: M24 family metallopeptidase [Nitriliruptorales bacterium]|nr:M24 family metallopeptidase [Nitriliruptorales bacterium]
MDRFARGQFQVAYEERIDLQHLRAQRVQKAQAERESDELDALLVWKDENVRYLTDLRPQLIACKSTALNGALLVSDDAPVLFCSGGERDRVDDTMPWVKEVHTIPIIEDRDLIDGFVRDILGPVLEDHGLASGTIGIDECNTALMLAIQRHYPDVTIADGDAPMLRARKIKLAEELQIIEEACAVADAVTITGLEAAKAGMRELEVAAEAMRTLFRLGGEYAHVMTPFVASGEHMAPPHRIASDKIIRNGDIVFVDIGASYGGYYGDIARATIVGRPSRRQQEVYTAVYACVQACIEKMRPGFTNKDAADAVGKAAADHGFPGRLLSLFIGHGVGMGANEPPYIGETLPGSPVVEFKPGMVFAVEPLIWVRGVRGGGGVRLEEMVAITEDEAHVFSRAPFEDRLLLP